MFTFGLFVAMGMWIAAIYWYNVANRRFARLVLGDDADQALTGFPRRRSLEAMRQAAFNPSYDAETEVWRVRNNRRFRVLILLMPLLLPGVPLLFGLVGDAAPAAVGRGLIGVAILAVAFGLTVIWAVRLAGLLRTYGDGGPMATRSLAIAVIGVVLIPTLIFVQDLVLR